MYELTVMEFTHIITSLMFFFTGIAYGMAVSSKAKPVDFGDLRHKDRIKALKLLDNIFSSESLCISYDKSSEALKHIKDLGGDYYYGEITFEKTKTEDIADLSDKIEAAFRFVEEVS